MAQNAVAVVRFADPVEARVCLDPHQVRGILDMYRRRLDGSDLDLAELALRGWHRPQDLRNVRQKRSGGGR